MGSGLQVILALVLIVAVFAFLPNILALGFGGGTSTSGTLTQPRAGVAGVLSVSFDGGETFKNGAVFTSVVPDVITIEAPGSDRVAFGDRKYFAGTNAGLLISKDNGLSWYTYTDLEKNIDATTVVYDLAFTPDGKTIFVSGVKNGHGVVYMSRDNLFTATAIWTEASMPVRAIAADNNYLYLGLSDGRFLRYDQRVQTFVKVSTLAAGVSSMNLTDQGTLFVGLSNGSIFTSVNGGASWQQIDGTKLALGSVFGSSGQTLVLDKENSSVMYLASASNILRSTDRGGNWNALNTILPKNAKIASLVADNGAIFITSGTKLYKSMDGGESWRIKEPIITTKRLTPLYVANNGALVIVGTSK